MRYLSIDLEATGLGENCFIIEFAAVPFCTQSKEVHTEMAFHCHVKCPSFEELKPKLDPWVVEHNEVLIKIAHKEGFEISKFRRDFENYLCSDQIKGFFYNQKITLFGKSMNAIDLPFLNRDLGWDFMRKYFSHRNHDLSAVTYTLIDKKQLPEECMSGSELSNHLGFGEVPHTALEDSVAAAQMYLKLI